MPTSRHWILLPRPAPGNSVITRRYGPAQIVEGSAIRRHLTATRGEPK